MGEGAWGPGPQASHQKGASHQTEETELNPSLRYKAESFLSVIDQFTASLDQRLQAYISYWLIDRAALVACQHYLQQS